MTEETIEQVFRRVLHGGFLKAADAVRKKRDSRRTWCGYSDSASTRERMMAIEESVERTLTEIADALDLVAQGFEDYDVDSD